MPNFTGKIPNLTGTGVIYDIIRVDRTLAAGATRGHATGGKNTHARGQSRRKDKTRPV